MIEVHFIVEAHGLPLTVTHWGVVDGRGRGRWLECGWELGKGCGRRLIKEFHERLGERILPVGIARRRRQVMQRAGGTIAARGRRTAKGRRKGKCVYEGEGESESEREREK